MASKMEDKQYGFDESRFEMKVSPNFLCSICLNVLKDPKMCGKNEHVFCQDCIAPHLTNFQTCPECMQHLTPETLKTPPRMILNCLSELKIYCIYNTRGCPDVIELGHLQKHEDTCDYAPVTCGNKGCEMEVNRKDKDEHEKLFCKVGTAVCHNCEDLMIGQKVLEKKLDELTQYHSKVDTKVDEIKGNLEEMKRNQAETQRNHETLGALMVEQLRDVKEMLEEMYPHLPLRHPDPEVSHAGNFSQEIIIVGGYTSYNQPTRTGEECNLSEVIWSDMPSMHDARGGAASCVRGDDFIIAGGGLHSVYTKTIEMLKVSQRPRQWVKLNARLPGNFFGHRMVIYQNKMLVIGGYNGSQKKASNIIYEILLNPPYTIRVLCRMSQPRVYHRVQMVHGKLFIFGGSTTSQDKDVLNSVIVYDIGKNRFESCLPLPYSVYHMSAVTWGSKVILLGGTDEDGNYLNKVTMYDTETETSTTLPSMKYRRRGSSAVIFDDRIFVMGGRNSKDSYLNTVESLKIGDTRWQEHEEMGSPRHVACAHGFVVPV